MRSKKLPIPYQLSFMKTKLKRLQFPSWEGSGVGSRFQAWLLCAAALRIGSSFSPAAAEFSDANWMSMGGLPAANGVVSAAVVDASGNLFIGGDFTIVGDVFANRVARWNGTNWSAVGSGLNNSVTALAVSGGDIYAASGSGVAKWDGSGWAALSSGLGSMSALAVSGNDVYVAIGMNVAKWNGTSWSALGSGINYPVSALAVSGSDVYAGGSFTIAGGVAANNIAKWNGSSWSAL